MNTKDKTMNVENLTVKELQDIAAKHYASQSEDIRIVVLQRGWVLVGRYKQDGARCTLTSAQNVRRWGTTRGLGEIAMGGPTANTQLDPITDAEFHELTVIATFRCDASKWSNVCK